MGTICPRRERVHHRPLTHLAHRPSRIVMKPPWVAIALAGCAIAAGIVWQFARPDAVSPAAMEPVVTSVSYVDNQRRLACHQELAAQWQQSHHAKSMALATAQTVLGNFNNAELRHQGIPARAAFSGTNPGGLHPLTRPVRPTDVRRLQSTACDRGEMDIIEASEALVSGSIPDGRTSW